MEPRHIRIPSAVKLCMGFGVMGFLALFAITAQTPAAAQSIIDTNRGDPAVDRAMQSARDTLARFDEAYRTRNGSDFQVRVAFQHPGGREHMWIAVSSVGPAGYVGTLINTPRHVATIRRGETYTAPRSRITDWTFKRDGLSYGHHVWRVLVSRMSQEEAASYGVRLSPRP